MAGGGAGVHRAVNCKESQQRLPSLLLTSALYHSRLGPSGTGVSDRTCTLRTLESTAPALRVPMSLLPTPRLGPKRQLLLPPSIDPSSPQREGALTVPWPGLYWSTY